MIKTSSHDAIVLSAADEKQHFQAFTRELFATQNLTILPGSYLARETRGGLARSPRGMDNPGRNRVRISLVATVEECVQAAQRIRNFLSK